MDDAPLRPAVVEMLRHTHDEEQALVAGLSEAERTAPGTPEHWSARDLLAHLTVWKEWTARRLEGAAQGIEQPADVDVDAMNARAYDDYRNIPLGEVEIEAERVLGELIGAVERMSEDDLTNPTRFTWTGGDPLLGSVLGNGVWHPFAHLAEWYRQHAQPQRAVEIHENLLAAMIAAGIPDQLRAGAVYNQACAYAMAGQADRALAILPEAFALDPSLRAWATRDPDFASLHDDPRFVALAGKNGFGGSQ